MKIPISWLRDYVDLPESIEEMAEKLSFSGLEVEEIIEVGAALKGIITGKIEEISPHPDADRLVVTQVNDGSKRIQIVTGATNISVGDIVPVSPPGAVLSNGMKIKVSKLRGIESSGMLCSEAELGVADEADGIWILPTNTPVGVDFIDYAQLKESLLDIAILPNRGDCQSIIGTARECATLLNLPLKRPEFKLNESKAETAVDLNSKSADCPLYSLRELSSCSLNKTPLWMQRRLELCGIRPIQLFVDITNYVLLEFGQPLHAFDTNSLKGTSISIENIIASSTFKALDGQAYTLEKDDLVICDESGPIAIAGVMGGKSTEVTENTTSVSLEAAYFDPIRVRKTGTRLRLRTESATRFEKSVDIEGVIEAANRASYLFQTLAGATVKNINVFKSEKDPLFKEKLLNFDPEGINKLLGTTYERKDIQETLESLGFKINGDTLVVPSFRQHDISELPCIAEEIARLKGMENIPSTLPQGPSLKASQLASFEFDQLIQNTLCARGFSEVNTFPMVSEKSFKKAGLPIEGTLHIANPISQDESVMRTQLFVSLLERLSFNRRRQQKDCHFFEIGKAFNESIKPHFEDKRLCVVASGTYFKEAYTETSRQENTYSIFHMKGLLEGLFSDHSISFDSNDSRTFLHPKKQCSILNNEGQIIGFIGTLHPNVASEFDVSDDTVVAEISFLSLDLAPKFPSYQSVSKFPTIKRDLALLAPKELSYGDIKSFLLANKPKLVTDIQLFDVFESDQLGEDKKSIAITFTYENKEASLTDDEVNKSHQDLRTLISEKLPVSIR
ncbi:phenylalanine--tRNA ligase subunit beta [Candidatus Marinamargulisbacteria bacterium SCGC AAA071-K20]|nr:phenylalanine--tRNA ligase subunit beta [Candidatus Marinamargulisbacteria bacterium SCGC AAA071-K20]